MLKSRFEWTILLLVLALLGGAWIAKSREPLERVMASADAVEAPIAGYLAPDFTLTTTIGEAVTLKEYRGRPVVLNFWASWCPPCRAEMTHFQAASVKYNGRAIVLGVDQGEPLPVVADFGASLGITYPLLLDESNAINRQYAINALPTTIFIDADGLIREVYTGIINRAVLEDRIERLLAEA